ncbi:MAG: molybdopterin adenylyltransferase [Methanobacterium sp.]|jgi:molybdenum cofactor biosynthesis protein B|uniref:MogA/MoaB family molybdenum cofactor biosynthesis protein n=1 Tax=Methanobacterium sp. TaxID=2164 RepID=UPI0003C9399D|nr:MogA/MoaB family molybdenum cofactor biosynthesis protein [Methanobacterium sp.]MDI3549233.1 molybdopterin adenylyltransferase [Methanobacterium sp.]CDG65392.1 molybdenum cofactor synthesis domain-containing protein [Methanobacterium sp. MB1]
MQSKTMAEHKKHSPLKVKVGIITLSDSKSVSSHHIDENFVSCKEDISGKLIIESLDQHEIVAYQVIPDDADLLLEAIEKIMNLGAQIIISTGGTGIGKRDITIETIKPLFDKELNGFGEVFRYETYKELGTGAIMTRATAGVWKETLLVALPGSPNAVQLGMKILKPELGHLVKHMKQ